VTTEGLNDNGERARKKFARERVKKRQNAPKSAKKRFFCGEIRRFFALSLFCAQMR